MAGSRWQNSSSALRFLLSALYRSFRVVCLAGFLSCGDHLRYVGQPAVSVGRFAVDDIEEPALNCFGDRSAAAVAYRNLVNRPDRRQLDGRPNEEYLVGDVEHFARDVLLRHAIAEILGDLYHHVARDAWQNRRAQRRRMDDAVADDEDVLAAALTHKAERIERNAFAVAVGFSLHTDERGVRVVAAGLRQRRKRIR